MPSMLGIALWIMILAGNNTEVAKLVARFHDVFGPSRCVALYAALGQKQLHGSRIKELLESCDNDFERFYYHVFVELPHQKTGQWPGLKADNPFFYLDSTEFTKARCFGKPKSFWALKNPPTKRGYAFPII